MPNFSEAEERISREVGPPASPRVLHCGHEKTNVNEIFSKRRGDPVVPVGKDICGLLMR